MLAADALTVLGVVGALGAGAGCAGSGDLSALGRVLTCPLLDAPVSSVCVAFCGVMSSAEVTLLSSMDGCSLFWAAIRAEVAVSAPLSTNEISLRTA